MIAYASDFYGWTHEQAHLLKTKNFANLDLANLIEEIESMGRSELSALKSRLEVLIMHLLKYQFQPEKRSKSWQDTIEEQRSRVEDLMADNPSFKYKTAQDDFLPKIWKYAVSGASRETGLPKSAFPSEPIWTLEQILTVDFLPLSSTEIDNQTTQH